MVTMGDSKMGLGDPEGHTEAPMVTLVHPRVL